MAFLDGTDFDDYITGTQDADRIRGFYGRDRLYGGDGNDRLIGGAGFDYLYGGAGDDVLVGDQGLDSLYGGAGNDRLLGGDGPDGMYGEEGNDALFGGTGDDYMNGGAGLDRFDGGAGLDDVSFYNPKALHGVIADLRSQWITDDGFGNRERMISVEGLVAGTVFSDVLYGNDQDNYLEISAGDFAFGFGGDDVIGLDSVKGAVIDGGDGNDTIRLYGVFLPTVTAGSFDQIQATQDMFVDLRRSLVVNDGFGYSANLISIENVYTPVLQNTVLIGSDDANILTSGDGNDRVDGQAGDDYLSGGIGEDLILGRDGDDVIEGGSGIDRLAGGSGADRFVYCFEKIQPDFETIQPDSDASIFDYGSGNQGGADRILDFSQQEGDRIDISLLAEYFSSSDQAFTFIGTDPFSGAVGEVRFEALRNGDTLVQVEVDGQSGADLSIVLVGAFDLQANDFIL